MSTEPMTQNQIAEVLHLHRLWLNGDGNGKRADLWGADLWGANLWGANLTPYQIPQEGELIVYKKGDGGQIIKLRIPPDAKRTASIVSRKCRAERAEVLAIDGADKCGSYMPRADIPLITYRVGETVHPDSYDPDPRVECSYGIHFFLTREEAEAF